MDREAELKKVERDVVRLSGSELTDWRREMGYMPVSGEGSSEARVMLVGEAPGETEAKCGKPFCGRAGKILDELLASVSLPREDVYITSIVKDRPPKNRDPKPEEIELYAPFLDRQIEIIEPAIIATLGRFSMQYVMNRYGLEQEITPISDLHGKIFDLPDLKTSKLIPLYHPAAAIYNHKLKSTLLEDFQVLKSFL